VSEERLRSLTKRQLEVFEHLAKHRSDPEIAVQLHVGIETVRAHRRALFRKLSIQARRELVA
jgi:DNA-binding CsgD family transcriptional regulator